MAKDLQVFIRDTLETNSIIVIDWCIEFKFEEPDHMAGLFFYHSIKPVASFHLSVLYLSANTVLYGTGIYVLTPV